VYISFKATGTHYLLYVYSSQLTLKPHLRLCFQQQVQQQQQQIRQQMLLQQRQRAPNPTATPMPQPQQQQQAYDDFNLNDLLPMS
jgi:hypothetical protein